jgi:YesN/AraC family two-component response regulator
MEMVAEASNGREALEHFREHRPDITFMDLQMPHAGDVQVSRALKSDARAYLLKGSLQKNC